MSKILMMMSMIMRHRLHTATYTSSTGAHDQCCDVVEDVESPRQPTSALALPLSRFSTSGNNSSMSVPAHRALMSISTSQSFNKGVDVHCSGGGGGGGGYLQWWRHKAEDCLWLASALFILYYGDFRSDFFTLLAHDARILRTPLHVGLVCLMLDVCVIVLYIAMMGGDEYMRQPHFNAQENQTGMKVSTDPFMAQAAAPGVNLQVVMLAIGSFAFILMCVALWPIWRFLTIPMLFTLFMATTVVAPYVAPIFHSKVKLDIGGEAGPANSYSLLMCGEHRKS